MDPEQGRTYTLVSRRYSPWRVITLSRAEYVNAAPVSALVVLVLEGMYELTVQNTAVHGTRGGQLENAIR